MQKQDISGPQGIKNLYTRDLKSPRIKDISPGLSGLHSTLRGPTSGWLVSEQLKGGPGLAPGASTPHTHPSFNQGMEHVLRNTRETGNTCLAGAQGPACMWVWVLHQLQNINPIFRAKEPNHPTSKSEEEPSSLEQPKTPCVPSRGWQPVPSHCSEFRLIGAMHSSPHRVLKSLQPHPAGLGDQKAGSTQLVQQSQETN